MQYWTACRCDEIRLAWPRAVVWPAVLTVAMDEAER
jgi:hypothetical protein